MAKMSDPVEIRNELRSTCSPVIHKLLFDFVGVDALNACTKQELLAHIKLAAVHKDVHCQKFHTLQQSPDESITRYLARLQAQALCEFHVKCLSSTYEAQGSYSEDMSFGQMISDLANAEHQDKVQAEVATLTSLQKKFYRLVSLETTDHSTLHLQAPQAPPKLSTPSKSVAQRSQYYQQQCTKKLTLAGKDSRSPTLCKGCGETSHPSRKSLAR